MEAKIRKSDLISSKSTRFKILIKASQVWIGNWSYDHVESIKLCGYLLNGGSINLRPIGLAVRSTSCLLPHPNLKELETIASKTATEHGFDLCGVQIFTHLQPMTMQVQIRHADGADVSLDECASFSAPMSEAIETSKLTNEAYVLEISSPGINENLLSDRDFLTFRGFPVEVTFLKNRDSKTNQTGLLHERSTDHIHLNIKGKISRIPRKDVIEVRLTTATG